MKHRMDLIDGLVELLRRRSRACSHQILRDYINPEITVLFMPEIREGKMRCPYCGAWVAPEEL